MQLPFLHIPGNSHCQDKELGAQWGSLSENQISNKVGKQSFLVFDPFLRFGIFGTFFQELVITWLLKFELLSNLAT